MNVLLESGVVLEIISAAYRLHNIQYCQLIRRGFNDHYLIRAGHDKYIFRIYLNHKYYIESPDAFKFELDLLEHLHNDGLSVSYALRTNDGELLGWAPTEQGKRAFALFPYAPGRVTDRDSLTSEQSFQLGRAMADIHISANRFQSKLQRYKLDLRYLVDEPRRLIYDKINGKESTFTSDQEKKELRSTIQSLGPIDELVDAVEQISFDGDAFGVIHADMNTGNVHFQNNKLVVFDFDHCAYGWRSEKSHPKNLKYCTCACFLSVDG